MWYYLGGVSLISIIICCADKLAARFRKRRFSEASLLGLCAVGGALAMFITMLIIRHKTKHMKFMVLLPLLAIAHVCLIIWFGRDFNYWL